VLHEQTAHAAGAESPAELLQESTVVLGIQRNVFPEKPAEEAGLLKFSGKGRSSR
jgi:hypothetical protein